MSEFNRLNKLFKLKAGGYDGAWVQAVDTNDIPLIVSCLDERVKGIKAELNDKIEELNEKIDEQEEYLKNVAEFHPKSHGVIGQGGFGCVVYPALVFWNSRVVTNETKVNYVTKIAEDALSEYDLAKAIEAAVPFAGIFPVDDAVCGLTYREMKQIAGANEVCAKKFPPELWRENVTNPRGTSVMIPRRRYRGTLAGGDFNSVCAIQYPRYDSDLVNVVVTPAMSQQLLGRLVSLHNAQIVHMDIKRQNLAKAGNDAFLSDWGFARFLTTEEDVNNTAAFVAREIKYYKKIGGDAAETLYSPRANDMTLTLDERRQALYDLDLLCLTTALL